MFISDHIRLYQQASYDGKTAPEDARGTSLSIDAHLELYRQTFRGRALQQLTGGPIDITEHIELFRRTGDKHARSP